MRAFRRSFGLLAVALALLPWVGARGAEIIAYSLGEAQERVKAGGLGQEAAQKLARITRPLGFVVDPDTKDIILVGAIIRGLPEARLDDLVVALRARLVHAEWPLVSIEPDTNTVRTGLQRAVFQGGIADTQFGRDFLEADVALKRYSLNVLPVHPEVATYRDLCAADAELDVERSGTKVEGIEWLSEEVGTMAVAAVRHEDVRDFASYFARFWFSPESEADLLAKQGVFCIERLNLIVSAENQQVAGRISKAFLGEAFARNFAQHFDSSSTV